MEGVLHVIPAGDDNLHALVRVWDQQHLLVQREAPDVVRAALSRLEVLIETLPDLRVAVQHGPRSLK